MTRPEHLPDHLIPEEEAHVTHPVDLPPETRTETDSLGSVEVPADAYWGVHTMRALENFPISKRPISVYPDLIRRARLGEAGRGAGEPRGRRAERREGRVDRPGLPAHHRRRVPRPVRRRRHPGRGRHVDEHERQRGHHQRRARDRRLRQGPLRHPAPHRRREPQPVDERHLPDGAQDRARLLAAARCSPSSSCCASRSAARPRSSTRSSRSGAPSCRTPCR